MLGQWSRAASCRVLWRQGPSEKAALMLRRTAAFGHEPAQNKTTFIPLARGSTSVFLNCFCTAWVPRTLESWGAFPPFSAPSPQGKHKCECKSHYVGDGLDCEPQQLPLDRCLQDNGQCHPDASCMDLHFQGQCGWGPGPTHLSLRAWVRGVCRGKKKNKTETKESIHYPDPLRQESQFTKDLGG